MNNEFDMIVIGSGMGGMTAATALSRKGHKVLLLEQAQAIGGLTHAFSREGFLWDVGLHYCGTFGHDQSAGRILDWLSGGAIKFHSVGTVYDELHFPDDFHIPIARPAEAYKMELKDQFPGHASEIDSYFDALISAGEAMQMVFTERSLPGPLRSVHRWWNKKKIQRWCGRTTSEVIADIVTDPKLASVLTAQWGTYGGKPNEASFGIHAVVMGHYVEGAGYPVGGASVIAKGLVPVIESAGGRALSATHVTEILIENEKVVGVRTKTGEEYRAPVIVSAIGAGETVKRLLPAEIGQQSWAQEIASLKPSVCHFQVFVGFEGDISKLGAGCSNHWFYESWDVSNAIWSTTNDASIPMMFVSFPSLKDPAHDPGPRNKHTGEFLIWADWSSVAEFAEGGAEARPAEWKAFKQNVEAKMIEFFRSKFPALAPLIVYMELGTPLDTVTFTGHEKGGFYGVETTPHRFLCEALNPKTPVTGLYLSGQDVLAPGIAGSLMSGILSAAAIDARLLGKLK